MLLQWMPSDEVLGYRVVRVLVPSRFRPPSEATGCGAGDGFRCSGDNAG